MAAPLQFVFNDNTYAGEELAGYMAKALLPEDGIVEKGLVTLHQNVKKKKVLRSLEADVEFQTPSDAFVAQTSPDITLGERYLEPIGYEVMIEMSMKNVKDSWESKRLKDGAMEDYEGEVDLTDFAVERLLKKIAIMNERLYVLGKANAGIGASTATFSGTYNGLLAEIKAASGATKPKTSVGELALTGITTATPGVVTVASTSTLTDGTIVTLVGTDGNQQYNGATIAGQSFQITVLSATTFSLGVQITGATPATTGKVQFVNASNCLAVFTKIYNEVSDTIRNDEDFRVYVSQAMGRAYNLAQAAAANGAGSYYIGKKELDFLGQALTPMNHWLPNTVLGAKTSNLHLGVDLIGDGSALETVNMRKTTLDQKLRMKCAMKSDVNYMFDTELYLMYPQA